MKYHQVQFLQAKKISIFLAKVRNAYPFTNVFIDISHNLLPSGLEAQLEEQR